MILKKSLIAMFIALFVVSPLNATVLAETIGENIVENEVEVTEPVVEEEIVEQEEVEHTEETNEASETEEAEVVAEENDSEEVTGDVSEEVADVAEESETASSTDAVIETETVEEEVTETLTEEPANEQATSTPSGFVDTVIEDLVDPLFGEEKSSGSNSDTDVDDAVTFVETVALDVVYTHKNNSQVKVVFTKLPENPGSLSIEEVILTEEQVKAFGALSNVAYDITSSMENGSFEYDLSLPTPKNTKGTSKVVYAENADELAEGNAKVVEDTKVTKGMFEDSVEVDNMNHFTIFIVTSFEEDQITTPEVGYNDIWFAFGDGGDELERVITGTNGIDSSVGNYHGEMTGGAFTRWNGYKTEFPDGGYDTRVDVYLDMTEATGSNDLRFDFSSAISTPSNTHRRDFIFHLGTNPAVANEWLASASNNSPGWPANPGLSPVSVTETGWYTLEHQFRDVAGVLEVTMNLYKKGNGTPVGTWVRTNPADIIDDTVGGNRYGWFIDNAASFNFDFIAIDQAEIEYTEPVPKTETTVVITEDTSAGENQLGWLFNRDQGTKTPFEFNTDTASIGDGALYVLPIDGGNASDKFIGELFLLDEIANIDGISYDFEIGAGGNASDENEFYMNVYANFGSSAVTNFYDCRYNVVPTVGVVGDFTTVTFDPTQSYPVTTRGSSPHTCPAAPADMDNLSSGSTIRVVAINLGDTSANDAGVDGYFDNVVVETSDEIVTYDFEYINEKPEVSIESPSPAENSFVKGLITGRAVATDDHGIGSSYLRFWKDSFESGIDNLVGNCQNAPGGDLLGTSVDATCELDSTTVSDGVYVFSAQFLDSDIEWGSALRTFTVDNTAPTMTITEPTVSDVVSGEITITGTANDATSGIVDDEVQIHFRKLKENGKCGGFENTLDVAVIGGEWSEEFDTTTLGDGEYCITGLVSDNAGNNNGGGTHIKSITIDNTAPTVTIKDSSVGNGTDLFSEVSFKLFDAYKIDKVIINGTVKDLGDNKWSDVNGVTPGTFGAVEGENTMVAYDVAGNTTTIEFVLDTIAPTVPVITSPTAEQVFATTPIANQWTTSTDELDVTYQIAYAYDDEHTFGGSTCSEVDEIDGKAVSGCRDTSGTTRNHTPALSEQGGVTIFVRAFDAIGNTSDWSEGVHYFYIVEEEEEEEGSGGSSEETADPFGVIISPIANATTSGLVLLTATYDDGDEDNDDAVEWSIQEGDCSVEGENVFGNIDGFEDPFDWDGANFSAEIDTEFELPGAYCFIFDPEDDGETDVRETVSFTIEEVVEDEEEGEEEVIPTLSLFSESTEETSSRTGGRRSTGGSSTVGQVLGASTGLGGTCGGMYLNSYMGMSNTANDAGDVALLQVFLNVEGYEIPVTGVYDSATIDAVNQFQLVHLEEILVPWGITTPTGNVFKTTRWKINDIVCPGSEVFPQI